MDDSTALHRTGHEHTLANVVPNTARSLLALIEDRGLPAERICRGLGFTPQELAAADMLLSHQQVRTLILRAYREIDDPALGLACGARQSPVSWGLPGLAMLTCETFGEAIEYGLEHQGRAGAMLLHRFDVTASEARMDVSARMFDVLIEPFLVEETFAGALSVARWLAGPSFRLLRVELAYERPDHAAAYSRLFRCPVIFGMKQHRLAFEAHWLQARLSGYDRVTCAIIRRQLNTLLQRPMGNVDVVESLSSRMRLGVENAASQVSLAHEINVSDRTLRRRLSAQDTSFRALRDDTRYQRARDLLANSSLTIAEVAEAVGYSDARAFRRAFKRWSGEQPATFREQNKSGRDGKSSPAS